jgi:hypothetical protein
MQCIALGREEAHIDLQVLHHVSRKRRREEDSFGHTGDRRVNNKRAEERMSKER